MSFNAGAVVGTADLNTKKWSGGVRSILGSTGKMISAMGPLIGVAGFAGLAASIGVSIAKANEYQKTFSNVNTLINQTPKELQATSRSLLSMDSALGSTTELTKGMYQAISAGAKPGQEAFDVVTQSAKFSQAALTSNSTAVDLLTTATNAYGKENVSTEKASNVFFNTIKQGKIDGEQLSATIGKSIPLFASLNVPLEELSSGMAAMTKQGISASESTTQLNGIMNAFLKPSEAMTAALKEQGFESGSAFIEAEGLTGALKFLEEQTGGNATEMGKLLPSIEAVKGVMALTGEGGKEFNKIMESMADVTGVTDEAFKKQEKTFATFRNELTKTQIIVGNIGKFFVDKIAVGAQTALEAMNQFLLSAKGLEFFEKIAKNVGFGIGLISEQFKFYVDQVGPNVNKLIEEVKDLFSDLFGEMTAGNKPLQILSGTMQILSTVMRVQINNLRIFVALFKANVKSVVNGAAAMKVAFGLITGDTTFEDLNKVVSKNKKVWADFAKTTKGLLIDSGQAIMDTVNNFGEQNKKLVDSTEKAMDKSSKKAAETVKKNYMAIVTTGKGANEEIEETVEETGDKQIEVTQSVVGAQKEIYTNFFDWYTAQTKETQEETSRLVLQGVAELGKSVWDGLVTTTQMAFDTRLDNMEESFSQENLALEDKNAAEQEELISKLEQGLITDAQFNDQKSALDAKQAAEADKLRKKQLKEENDIKEKQFKLNKAFAIGQIWISAAQAIMGFWAAYAPIPFAGPIIAGAMTGVALGVAGVQTGLVASQKYIPAKKDGGMASGVTRINEEGGEIVKLPDQSLVIPNDISSQIARNVGGNSGGDTTIQINNPVVREEQDINKIAQAVDKVLSKKLTFA